MVNTGISASKNLSKVSKSTVGGTFAECSRIIRVSSASSGGIIPFPA
jgi:hypothetical protein